MAQSLADISKRYGQYSTFGHKDYEAAKQQGYSDQDILKWLNADLDRLHQSNRPGGPDGLYDEILKGAVDLSKKVDIDRGAPAQVGSGGMTPFEYDYQKTLDIANIDKQIKEMQLESAENIQKLSNMNKLSVANTAVNQSILGGLVSAFNF